MIKENVISDENGKVTFYIEQKHITSEVQTFIVGAFDKKWEYNSTETTIQKLPG